MVASIVRPELAERKLDLLIIQESLTIDPHPR
jgi:hypothetical protein